MTEKEVVEVLGEALIRWVPKENEIIFQYSKSKESTHYRLRQISLADGRVKQIIGYYYID